MALQASVSPVRRARHRARTQIFEHSALYLPFARHKYRGQPPHFRNAWVPSANRASLRPALPERWLQPDVARLRKRAQSVYYAVREAADPAGITR